MTDAEKVEQLEKQLQFLRRALVDHLFYTSSATREQAEDIARRLYDQAEVYAKYN